MGKKDKKANPSFTRMKEGHPDDLEKFLSNYTNTQGELNHNGVVAPKIENTTVFSSHKDVKEANLNDFNVLKVIGRKVCLVEYLPTHETYAMKILKKDLLIEQEQIENTLLEKEIITNYRLSLIMWISILFPN